ncbi:DUF4439 domain-containing protein [Propionibacterium freudenreichii]|uniref:DUF4439 domain-containing protein n=1 Tax=Propionibacterium freudenreichii TaxID=1744 RepID=UPI0005A5C6D8|nr:DUF4439 domain-containing protein [Propionibacterium freudenreichii]MDK9332040.1 DUF4439 domain-containing protein [Propionibacterium freudenreichii]CEI49502.1 Hypothetical protein PFCIRM514_05050 [Propionibacterium freudenreichii]
MPTRRSFLFAALTVALVGCAPSPVVNAPRARGSLKPATDALRTAALDEQALATLTGTIAQQGESWRLSTATTAWCSGATTAHREHLTTLVRADPLGGVNADDSPVIDLPATTAVPPQDAAGALAQLAAGYATAADHCRSTLMAAPTGPGSLLWASLYCFSTAGAATLAAHPDGTSPGTPPVAGQAVPTGISVGSRDDRLAALLSRIDALRYGLETMIGRSGGARTDMKQRRTAVDNVRNQVAAQITAGSATPAGPAIDYELPGDVTNPTSWDAIWGELEAAVLSAWVSLAAASDADSDGRRSAMAGIDAQCLVPGQHGVGLAWWPSWV